MKYKDIKSFFDEHFSHLKYDKKLAIALSSFRIRWATKTHDITEFLGGTLTGVNVVKFTDTDTEELFTDILGVDIEDLEKEIKKVKGINPKFKVSPNPVYQGLLYLIYMYTYHSNLNAKDKEAIVLDIYRIFAYRALSSTLTRYFRKYQLDRKVALSVYESMSNRFILKRLGSWQAVVDYRANDILDKKALHGRRLKRYTTDDTVRIVNDLQGKLKVHVLEIFSVIVRIQEAKETVSITSLTTKDIDGDEVTRDIIHSPKKYTDKLVSIYTIPVDLIKPNLISLSYGLIKTASPGDLELILTYISQPNPPKVRKLIEGLLEDVVAQSLKYLTRKGVVVISNANIDYSIKLLIGFWTSSKIPDPKVRRIREIGNSLAFSAIKSKNTSRLSSARTIVFTYLLLRGLTD